MRRRINWKVLCYPANRSGKNGRSSHANPRENPEHRVEEKALPTPLPLVKLRLCLSLLCLSNAKALLAFGIIWTIVDAIYGPALSVVFVASGVGFKVIFVGVIGAAEFAALIGVMMIFKWIYLKIAQGLYLQIVPEGKKPALPTKIIVAGVMVGIYIMAFAGILAVLDAILQASPLQTLPFGPLFIAIGVLILLFSVLTLVGIFLFHNGLHFISEKVTESVEEMDVEMTKVEEEQEKLRQ